MEGLIRIVTDFGLSRDNACVAIGVVAGFILGKALRFRRSVPALSNGSSATTAASLSAHASSTMHGTFGTINSVSVNGKEVPVSAEQFAEILSLLKSGKKIEAIKKLRAAAALDLAGAKAIVDDLDR